MTELEKSWKKLSDLQRQASEWNEGALLVLAGPGAGKTRVLTCRIAHLLEATEGENFRILGLTFTNKAADEMRARLIKLVPEQEKRLFLGTFHSFCAEILRQHGSHIGIRPNFSIYSQNTDLEAILSDAVANAKKTHSIVSDLDKKTLPVIHRLKSSLIFPDKCREVLKNPEFGERMTVIYPAYEDELAKRNALDFTSLILRTYQLFERYPAFARRYRTVYPYICVDEFQDTNEAQYQLLRVLMGDIHNNIFVVADDDQIIYQWNGASHKRIEEFSADFNPTVIQLPVNYRCPSEIVELANNLIQCNFLRTKHKQPLISHAGSAGSNTVRLLPVFADNEDEAVGIAIDIKHKHSNEFNDVVVIARNRKLLLVVEKALRDEGVAAVIAQRKNEFESTPMNWLHAMLKFANNQQDRRILEEVCGTFKQLTDEEINDDEVATEAEASDQSLFRRWIKSAERLSLDKEGQNLIILASRYLGGSSEFARFCEAALTWFDHIADCESIKQKDVKEEMFALYKEEREVWNELVREICGILGQNISLQAFLQELQMRSKETPPGNDTVRLFTIHASKGKEFDHVYLVGLVEDELPSFQSINRGDKSPEMEEERRNCFVAITRASKTLTFSYAHKYRGWYKKPSRFLFEMGILNEK